MEYFSGETKAYSTKAYGAALGASQAAKDHGKASKMQRHMGRLSMTPCTATTAENPKKRLGTRQV